MTGCEHCRGEAVAGDRERRISRAVRTISKWSLPGVILVLIPKCPLCLAGYVTLLTGIGLSVGTARLLHHGLWLVGVVLLGLLLLQALLTFWKRRFFVHTASSTSRNS